MRKLTGPEQRRLSDALLAAFPTWPHLQRMLKHQLDWDLAHISSQFNGMEDVVFDLLRHCQAHDSTDQLILGALAARPGNAQLAAFMAGIGATTRTPPQQALERTLNEDNTVFDVETFRRRLAEIERRVCRVDINSAPMGTAFLVGPDVAITNYHVVANIIHGRTAHGPSAVSLLFDYRLMADGAVLNPGTRYSLAPDWLVDHSTYSKFDLMPEPKPGLPQANELDFALLRVAGAPGNDPVSLGGGQGAGTPVRGWIPVPANTGWDFSANKTLFIVQHPRGDAMKLTVNTFRGFNGNKTRVTYYNDTDAGSSGSPCFNGNWELVALHHSGDPDFREPEYNQGIPLQAILALLQQRGYLNRLG